MVSGICDNFVRNRAPHRTKYQSMDVIDGLSETHIKDLHQLYQQEWWTNNRTLEQTQAVVAGSQICIGVIDDNDRLVGFTRVLTDYAFKALIFDVIVAKSARGQGLGDHLISLVKNHPKLADVKSLELYCLPEMFEFYQRHGFTEDVGELRLMRLY